VLPHAGLRGAYFLGKRNRREAIGKDGKERKVEGGEKGKGGRGRRDAFRKVKFTTTPLLGVLSFDSLYT